MSAALTLYNSLTRTLEPFAPLDPAKGVRVYSCGPTVYNYAHLGNLRAYVFTDTLSRVLSWKGHALTHVINITDVGHLTSDADAGDDKMEAAARAQAKSIWDVAAHYTAAFKQNIADLNIRQPSRWSVATDHIAEMIDFATKIAPAHCYELDSGLYFDTSTVADYGHLAGSQDDTREGRIEAVEGKRHPQDFAIWRKSPPGEQRQMEWDSPWGNGAPGWHLECSVMSLKYLGAPFDIHTGGIDHREIHHPNEIAQNQAFCGCDDTGAHFWMHNNFLVDRGAKMSKSKGGFTTLQSLIDAGVHPLAYRLLCLQAHYRKELEFSSENIAAALTRLKRLVIAANFFLARNGAHGSLDNSETAPGAQYFLDRLDQAISDDLNTPIALTVLDEMLSSSGISPYERDGVLHKFDALFGLRLSELTREELRVRPAGASFTAEEVELRLAERKKARAARDFARSDAIRTELTAAGVEVMDGDPLGWDWKPAL
ncbi:cysteine--tRNA ligase [Sphingomonas gei]|uniref:Cysteine--tRNA ligase n=1 Tax=Sphingomonas gei TaxID=1395960 RepID=A0A4S1XJ66_9SPHN|nr:cysteine--tRNA ligase [Sphingomonas gei]TGX56087.1 cysteine--tRNA ligase [Sphingomonas gei]